MRQINCTAGSLISETFSLRRIESYMLYVLFPFHTISKKAALQLRPNGSLKKRHTKPITTPATLIKIIFGIHAMTFIMSKKHYSLKNMCHLR